jgi:hypothetical protein
MLRRSRLRLFRRIALRSRCQRQTRSIVQHLAFLRGELAETARLDFALPSFRWHGPQRLDGVLHCLPTVWRKAPVLRIQGPELLFLLGSQVLPRLHAAKDLLLSVLRHAVEMLQSLFESLLPVARKAAELRVISQRSFLLVERLSLMLIQPLSGVMAGRGWLIRPRHFILPWLFWCGLELRPGSRLVLWLRAWLIFAPVEFRPSLGTGLALVRIRAWHGTRVVSAILGE